MPASGVPSGNRPRPWVGRVSQRRTSRLQPARRARPGAVSALGLALLLSTWAPPAAHAETDLTQGCGGPAPAVAPVAVEVGGQRRGLIVAVPADYRPTMPHALVVAFHGRTSSNANVRRYYDLERHADVPTIFVYPSGLRDGSGGYTWAEPDDPRRGAARLRAVRCRAGADRALLLPRPGPHLRGRPLARRLVRQQPRLRARRRAARHRDARRRLQPRATAAAAVAALLFHNPNDRLVAFGYGLRARDAWRADNGVAGPGRQVSARRLHLPALRRGRQRRPGAVVPAHAGPHALRPLLSAQLAARHRRRDDGVLPVAARRRDRADRRSRAPAAGPRVERAPRAARAGRR